MVNKNNWNRNEVSQLKECYDLAIQFEKLDTVRDVLRKKIKKIGSSGVIVGENTYTPSVYAD